MARANKSHADKPVTGEAVPETQVEPTQPEATQPEPPQTEPETKTENKPATAQAPKSKTSRKLALRKERLGR